LFNAGIDDFIAFCKMFGCLCEFAGPDNKETPALVKS
jgi:hypothetical protein